MDRRTRFLGVVVVIVTVVALSSVGGAGEIGQVDASGSSVPAAPSTGQGVLLAEPYGVAVTPAVYFVNFLLLYIANPNEAANMPAYRATIPSALYDCLKVNPQGCPYAEFARFFDDQPGPPKGCSWPTACQETSKWNLLAPSIARHPRQINEPLGMGRAKRLAESVGIDGSMILTDAEYQCTIGTPPRTPDQETIFSCIANLTNSNGNTNIPLSSYGLAITDQGDVQSLCAPEAPCLVFNQLFAGPLENIAAACGWGAKLERMVRLTPFLQFADAGHACQQYAGVPTGACVVEPICPSARPAP